jgi:hypothetical protein
MLRVIPGRGPHIPDEDGCSACDVKDAEITRLQIERDGFGISATAWATDLQKAGKEIARLQVAVRKMVEALRQIGEYGTDGICPYGCDGPNIAQAALTDPVIVALRRE